MRSMFALLAVVALVAACPVAAQQRVKGGPSVDVRDAPWSVLVRVSVTPSRGYYCTGAILDATHVVTAAHCVDLGPNGRAALETMSVRAGVSAAFAPRATDVPQDRELSSYRIHPGYRWTLAGAPDDVAVLVLAEPLDLSGPTATAIALTSAADQPAAGSAVSLAGFGATSPNGAPTFALNGLNASVDGCKPYESAVVFCALSETSSMCFGDSGAALVSTSGGTPELLGIGSVASCAPGTWGRFGNVGAPEIALFLHGDDNPPIAPRARSTAELMPRSTTPRVTQWVRCAPGHWSGSPRFNFRFLNEKGKVLQNSTSSHYQFKRGDVSHRIHCRFSATNPGGTAFETTEATQKVQARQVK